jgi:hypothetical protein
LHHLGSGKPQTEPATMELYNLEDDPMETKDVAADNPERVQAMQEALRRWMGSVIDSLNGDDYE